MNSVFKQNHTLLERKRMMEYLTKQHPEKIYCIVDFKADNEVKLYKFCIERSAMALVIMSHVRHKTELAESEALFLFNGNSIIRPNSLMVDIYSRYKDGEDDFVYITVTKENTFGFTFHNRTIA